MSAIKIWKMNDCDWIAAETLDQAKQCLADTVSDGVVNKEFEDEFLEDPEALFESTMEKLTLREEGEPEEKGVSFKKVLENMIAKGEKFPCFFASTEY